MPSLNEMDINSNRLTDLTLEITETNKLRSLDLSNNQLTSLPSSINYLRNLEKLDSRNNPLPIPIEILERISEPSVIIDYYLQMKMGQKKTVNEVKLILVGQGGVGKTSLTNRLVTGKFNPEESETLGINIFRWKKNINGDEIAINIWDFGGQEIMHSTHQFFLTHRSLYLLVLDSRLSQQENRVEYWLKMVRSFGGDSPVIVISNKVDQQHPDIDSRGLQLKYPNIKGFYEISCKENRGVIEIENAICKEINNLPHIHDQLLVSWFSVKDKLEQMSHDYLPYGEYIRICQQEGIEDKASQRNLINFLHNLGVAINYSDDPRLEETNILNPHWITNGVYQILNSNDLFHSKGVLDSNNLDNILDQNTYPHPKHLFIIDMMKKFELCYELDTSSKQKWLVPDLLPKEEPFTGEWNNSLSFQYHYNVLPTSIISRFIVRLHPYIIENTVWRSGILIGFNGNEALVKADYEDHIIYVWIRGDLKNRRDTLSAIRIQIESIHLTIPGLETTEKVPIPGNPNVIVGYQHLLTLERLGEKTFIPEGMKDHVNVSQLLDGIKPKAHRSARNSTNPRSVRPGNQHKNVKTNPWQTGLFFIFTFSSLLLLVIGSIIAARQYLKGFEIVLALITVFLGITIIGLFLLKYDLRLGDDSFTKIFGIWFENLTLLTPKRDKKEIITKKSPRASKNNNLSK